MDELSSPTATVNAPLQKELERQANDLIRVHNPTDEDYVVYWDGFGHVVRAHEDASLPRYIARNYRTQMVDKILTKLADDQIAQVNEKRKTQGLPPLTPQERETQEIRINNPELRKQWLAKVWKGIDKEFGKDTVAPQFTYQKRDSRPLDEQLLDEIQPENEPIQTEPVLTQPVEELPDNTFQLQKLAKERGIPVAKTDKKTELIAKLQQ